MRSCLRPSKRKRASSAERSPSNNASPSATSAASRSGATPSACASEGRARVDIETGRTWALETLARTLKSNRVALVVSIVCRIGAFACTAFLAPLSCANMTVRCVQLVLHYDGSAFAGWQRQPDQRTIQGELERVLSSLCDQPIAALGAGRTDAGVHARGQAVGIRVPDIGRLVHCGARSTHCFRSISGLRRRTRCATNFTHVTAPCRVATAYYVGTDDHAQSPFRRRTEWPVLRALDRALLERAAGTIAGEHSFRAFAVRGTAPAHRPSPLPRVACGAGASAATQAASSSRSRPIAFCITWYDFSSGQWSRSPHTSATRTTWSGCYQPRRTTRSRRPHPRTASFWSAWPIPRRLYVH